MHPGGSIFARKGLVLLHPGGLGVLHPRGLGFLHPRDWGFFHPGGWGLLHPRSWGFCTSRVGVLCTPGAGCFAPQRVMVLPPQGLGFALPGSVPRPRVCKRGFNFARSFAAVMSLRSLLSARSRQRLPETFCGCGGAQGRSQTSVPPVDEDSVSCFGAGAISFTQPGWERLQGEGSGISESCPESRVPCSRESAAERAGHTAAVGSEGKDIVFDCVPSPGADREAGGVVPCWFGDGKESYP